MPRKNLADAMSANNNEFYTLLSVIEQELVNYKEKFEGKVVFCNCDDPFESNFVKYFLMHFNGLKLKELIATGYQTSPVGGKEISTGNRFVPYALRVTSTQKYLLGTQKDLDGRSAQYFLETEGKKIMTPLSGDANHLAGDFRSKESIQLLQEADIVCTNPPFSLFREYIPFLLENNKKFLVLGPLNATSYKEIFPLLKENEIWWGINNGSKEYMASVNYAAANPNKVTMKNGIYYTKMGNTVWYTNIDHAKRHTLMPHKLGHTYYGHESSYPKFDNFDAICVRKVDDIPADFTEYMGVPTSFLNVYCPEQFEIIDGLNRYAIFDSQNTNARVRNMKSHNCNVNGKATFLK